MPADLLEASAGGCQTALPRGCRVCGQEPKQEPVIRSKRRFLKPFQIHDLEME